MNVMSFRNLESNMKTAQPIRNRKDIELLKMYLKQKSSRNYLLLVMLMNTNLRVSDGIDLKVSDVADGKKIKEHISLTEKKTRKYKKIRINESLSDAIKEFIKQESPSPEDYLFKSRKGDNHISRQQAHKILADAADWIGLKESVSAHSLRKTWAYHAIKNGTDINLLSEALNHSSQAITRKYIGITQDDVDDIYIKLNL